MPKNRRIAVSIIVALVLLALICATLPAGVAHAAISVQQGWNNLYAGAAYPGTFSYAVGPGSERILIVAVSSTRSNAGTQTISASYGGQPLTLAIGDGTSSTRQHTYILYLYDTPAVMNGSLQNLTVSITHNGFGFSSYNFVYAAVYAGVDPAGPVSDTANFNGGTRQARPVGPFSPALTIPSGGQAVEIINLTRGSGNARSISTWASNWSSVTTDVNSSYRAYIATDTTAGSTTSQHNASGNTLRSMSAVSLSAFVPTPTRTATFTITYTRTDTPTVTHTPTITPTSTPTATPTETLTPTITRTPTPTWTQDPACLPYTDYYEPDDSVAQATVVPADGSTQDHLNMPANNPGADADWYTFQAVAGHSYEIRTMLLNDINSGDTAANDTLLYLYGTDGATQIGFNDDVGNATWYNGYYYYRESIITWTAPASGWYFVRELQWGPTGGYAINNCHAYSFWIQDLTAPPPTYTPTRTPTATLTRTPTVTATATPTVTPTPVLSGASSVVFSALILNAPQFGQPAQTVTGTVQGGIAPYQVTFYIKAPGQSDGEAATYSKNVPAPGGVQLTPADAGVVNFGCDQEGIWEAWFVVVDNLGATATSNRITWTVNLPRVHGIP
jgi:hypothetical protein